MLKRWIAALVLAAVALLWTLPSPDETDDSATALVDTQGN